MQSASFLSLLLLAQGLILVNATSGLTTILANRVSPSSSKHPGAEIIFADDLDVASDGTVYFSTMTDIALPRGASGHYEAMPPCVLNIMQVCYTQPVPYSLKDIGQAVVSAPSICWGPANLTLTRRNALACGGLMHMWHQLCQADKEHAAAQSAEA